MVTNNLQYEKYFKSLKNKHNSTIDVLSVISKHFKLIPKGRLTEQIDELRADNFTDFANRTGVPEDIIWDLIQNEVISQEISDENFHFLKIYLSILEDETLKSKKSKRRSTTRPDLKEEWRGWVYLRYLSFGTPLSIAPWDDSHRKIYLRSLKKEVAFRFGIPITSELHVIVKGIRSTAYNDRRKVREQGLSVIDGALQRGVSQTLLRTYLSPVCGERDSSL